jgi:hypothetical protein
MLFMVHEMWHETWQRLRLLGVVGAAGATVILHLSAARLLGLEEGPLRVDIGQHR